MTQWFDGALSRAGRRRGAAGAGRSRDRHGHRGAAGAPGQAGRRRDRRRRARHRRHGRSRRRCSYDLPVITRALEQQLVGTELRTDADAQGAHRPFNMMREPSLRPDVRGDGMPRRARGVAGRRLRPALERSVALGEGVGGERVGDKRIGHRGWAATCSARPRCNGGLVRVLRRAGTRPAPTAGCDPRRGDPVGRPVWR